MMACLSSNAKISMDSSHNVGTTNRVFHNVSSLRYFTTASVSHNKIALSTKKSLFSQSIFPMILWIFLL